MIKRESCERFLQIVEDAKRELPFIRNRIKALQSKQSEVPESSIEAGDYKKELEAVIQKLMQEERKLLSAETALEEFIQVIPDSESRVILRLRFMDGLPWDEIGEKVYRSRSRVCDYFKNKTMPLVRRAWTLMEGDLKNGYEKDKRFFENTGDS